MLTILILGFFFLFVAFHDSIFRWWRGALLGGLLFALIYWAKGLKP